MAVESIATTAADHAVTAVAGSSSVLTGILTGLLTGLASVAALLLTGFGKDRATRLDVLMKYANEQINDFYAPLVALTSQLAAASDALNSATKGRSEEEGRRIGSLMHDASFDPLHAKIMMILTSKLHLLEGRTMPPSFDEVIAHITAITARQNLGKQGVDTSRIMVPAYPEKFYDDVRTTLDVVSTKQEKVVEDLQRLALPTFPRLVLFGRWMVVEWPLAAIAHLSGAGGSEPPPGPPRGASGRKAVHYLALVDYVDGAYTMTVADCPACTGRGGRFAEALEATAVSLQAWIAARYAGGADVPRPRDLAQLRADSALAPLFAQGAVIAAVPTPSERLRRLRNPPHLMPMPDIQ